MNSGMEKFHKYLEFKVTKVSFKNLQKCFYSKLTVRFQLANQGVVI